MKTLARMLLLALVLVPLLLLFLAWVTPVGARTGVIVYEVVDHETSIRIVTNKGVNLLCLITPEGHGWTGDPGWVGFTCAVVGAEPILWQFCRGVAGKPLLLCTNADTTIKGIIEDADPGNAPKMRMKAFESP